MPSSASDFTVNVNDVLYIDRWGISSLTNFNTHLNVQVWNQSTQPVYVKAVINDANGNWKFNDGTTEKTFGGVNGFDYKNFKATLKRAVPSSDVEDEQFTITFEFYKDDSYSTKIDQITKTIKVNIIDFHASPSGWTVNIDDFDDGTAQGWEASLFSVSNEASIKANGYSMYRATTLTYTSETLYIHKNMSIPSATKVALIFYYGMVNTGSGELQYVRVYVNDTKVYEDRVNFDSANQAIGWEQVSLDLTPYVGEEVIVKIEVGVYNRTGNLKTAIDEIIFAYK